MIAVEFSMNKDDYNSWHYNDDSVETKWSTILEKSLKPRFYRRNKQTMDQEVPHGPI